MKRFTKSKPQFYLLLRRYLKIKLSGTINKILFFGQFVVIWIICLTTSANFENGNSQKIPEDLSKLPDFGSPLFAIILAVIFFGILISSTDIAIEHKIIEREKRGSLKIGSYLLSKIIALMVLCGCLQSLLIPIVIEMTIPTFDIVSIEMYFKIFFLFACTYFASFSLGLLISASVQGKVEFAQKITPYVVVFKMIFAGMLVRLGQMPDVMKWFSNLSIARWGFEGLLIIYSEPLKYVENPQGKFWFQAKLIQISEKTDNVAFLGFHYDMYNIDLIWIVSLGVFFLMGIYFLLKYKN